MKCNVLIVGAGPSGIFTAYEMIKGNTSKSIAVVEKGVSLEKRRCPKSVTKECMHCKPFCHITTGFSGAGAFSDGKLSLSTEVGGDLPELLGNEIVKEAIDYTDKIYIELGADKHVEGSENNERIKDIRRKAIKSGLKLVDCPIRHLGTEKAQEIYLKLENILIDSGVNIMFNTQCDELIIESGVCKGVKITDCISGQSNNIFADKVIVCTGRKGAGWLEKMCRKHGIYHTPGPVDIGVRVEVRNEIMEEVNNILYESKLIGYPEPFANKVRTFCQNPGGFVSQENYDDDLAVVNGHSYKDIKSDNTNLSILCSHHFSEPFDQPIEYAQIVGRLMNMLGDGRILVQRYGDILEGKRTWEKELMRSNVKPTLPDAVAGDISSAMPYRTLTNILKFIEAVDVIVPGFAAKETLLYAPEIKFYSNCITMDKELNTNIKNLHCLGDSSGWTRGLMMSSVMGIIMGRILK